MNYSDLHATDYQKVCAWNRDALFFFKWQEINLVIDIIPADPADLLPAIPFNSFKNVYIYIYIYIYNSEERLKNI